MTDIARKLFAFLQPSAAALLFALFCGMFLVALLDMASIGLVLPLIHALFSGEGGRTGIELLDSMLPEGLTQERLVLWAAAVFAAAFLVKNVALLAMSHAVNVAIKRKQAAFLSRMFDSYMEQPLIFHLRRNSAEILRNLMISVPTAFESVRLILVIVLEALLISATCALLLYVEPTATLVAAGSLFALGFGFYRVMTPLLRHWGERVHALEGESARSIVQALGGIRDVKLLDCTAFLGDAFRGLAFRRSHYQSRSITAQQTPRLLIETVIVFGFLVIVVALSATKDSMLGMIASLGLFAVAGLRLMPSFNRLLTSASDLRQRTAAIDALHRDLTEAQPETADMAQTGSSEAIPFEREIRLDTVRYSYPDAEHSVLHGIDLVIEKGESVGFVGSSGAGKTTLIDIVLGLLRPESGRLLVDENDVFENVRGWRRRLGYVPQDVYLLDDTLKRNIAFGLHDEQIDDDRIALVSRMASLGDLVAGLPQGFDTVIGEQGARLSGGQRQRVAIARALYRDPDVLVFDEATAALDNVTEREITDAIERLSGEKTILIVAHRLSTVRNCHRIVFLKEGNVVAIGPFDQLVSGNEDFRRLAHLAGLGHAPGTRKREAS